MVADAPRRSRRTGGSSKENGRDCELRTATESMHANGLSQERNLTGRSRTEEISGHPRRRFGNRKFEKWIERGRRQLGEWTLRIEILVYRKL